MELLQVVVLAIVQGITEFLPVSSSGHLILVPYFFGWPDQGLAYDAAIHIGTLAAIVLYFRQQLTQMAGAWVRSITQRERSPDARLAWVIVLGTFPVCIVGLLFNDFIETNFRSPMLVATTLSVYGILLWLADRFGRRVRDEHSVTWRDGLVIGFAQALALVPGTSRSGITMTAGLSLGLTREGAARFSFLLAVPATVLAAAYEVLKMFKAEAPIDWLSVILGIALAAISGLACIHFLLRFLQKFGMLPFTIYRLLLAGVIVYVFA